jgi:hypothetical protein
MESIGLCLLYLGCVKIGVTLAVPLVFLLLQSVLPAPKETFLLHLLHHLLPNLRYRE